MKGASWKLTALVSVTLLFYVAFGAYVLSGRKTLDFFSYYAAASLVAAGQGSEIYNYSGEAWVSASRAIGLNPAAADATYPGYPPYLYPPTFSLLMVPFTLVSPPLAAGIWFFLSFLLLGLSVWSILRAWRIPLASQTSLTLALLVLWLVPFSVTLHAGQVNLIVFFLLAVAASGLKRGRPWAPGVAVGIAAAIKVFPVALLAYFLWKKEMKAFLGGVIAGGVFLALAFPVVGLGPFLTYVHQVLPGLSTGVVAYPPNQSWLGFVARLGPVEGVQVWAALGVGVVVLATALACSVNGKSPRARCFEFSAVLVGALLVSAISWEHYLVLLALPLWLMVLEAPGLPPFLRPAGASVRWWRGGMGALAVLALAYILVDLQGLAWHWLLAYPLLLSLGLYGTVLVWLFLVANLLGLARGRGVLSLPAASGGLKVQ